MVSSTTVIFGACPNHAELFLKRSMTMPQAHDYGAVYALS